MSRQTILSYEGKVDPETGAIALPKRVRQETKEAFGGKRVEVTIKRAVSRRSDPQLKYYWAVIVPYVLEALIDLGHEGLVSGNAESKQIIHEFLKGEFLPKRMGADANSELIELPASTKTLSKSDMADYFESIFKWSAECLNIVIPLPNEQLEIWKT
jgi:hypothetical protein